MVSPSLLRVEARDHLGRVVVDLLYDEVVTLPDGSSRVVPHRRQATGDALGERVVGLMLENEVLRQKVQDLEESLAAARRVRGVKKGE